MTKIRCLLIDDEPPALALLKRYAAMVEQIDVLGESSSAVQAFDMLKDRQVDLLFLDIQMPVLNGIDFLRTLKHPPAVILTTAYREYALEGYDLDIIDYLLKPIAFDRFLKAVDRYRDRHRMKIVSTSQPSEQTNHIVCHVNRTKHKIMLDSILYVESLKDYVRIHMEQGALVVKGNIGIFEKRLPVTQFIRIHRSFVVSLNQINSFSKNEIKIGGEALPIGVSYQDKVAQQLNEVF